MDSALDRVFQAEEFDFSTGWLGTPSFRNLSSQAFSWQPRHSSQDKASADAEFQGQLKLGNLARFYIIRGFLTSVFLIRTAFPSSVLDRRIEQLFPQSHEPIFSVPPSEISGSRSVTFFDGSCTASVGSRSVISAQSGVPLSN